MPQRTDRKYLLKNINLKLGGENYVRSYAVRWLQQCGRFVSVVQFFGVCMFGLQKVD